MFTPITSLSVAVLSFNYENLYLWYTLVRQRISQEPD